MRRSAEVTALTGQRWLVLITIRGVESSVGSDGGGS
jgi:hypothetical protein